MSTERVGFCQIYLRLPVDLCIARDSQRPPAQQVGRETIARMATRIEEPNVNLSDWESASIVLDASSPFADAVTLELCEAVLNILQTPPPEPTDDAEEEKQKNISREANMRSLGHQVDLHVRKVINQSISVAPSAVKKSIAESLNSLKQRFMASLGIYKVEDIDEAVQSALADFTSQADWITLKLSKTS